MLERIQNTLKNIQITRDGGWLADGQRHIDFLKDMIELYTSKSGFSSGQRRYISFLEERYTDEYIQEEVQWRESYNDDLREIAVRCAHYYNAQTPIYYSFTVSKVLGAPTTHVLSKKEFHKMCMNKYADKVLQEYKTDARYKVGDLVTPRANSSHKHKGHGLILAANFQPITRACKGSKPYKVKFLKSNKVEIVHEKEIKSIRRKK